ncbi:TPA: arginase [Staphylococcus aureus]|nr:arginase [Staphylococcus aureus]HCG2873949.1 arginase [Staphylococcus aureus]
MTKKKGIDIIGVPSTFGQRKLGVDLGPTAIRYAGLIPRLKQLDLDVNDKGDIKVSVVDIEKFQSEQKGLRNYDEIIDVTQKLNKKVSVVDIEKFQSEQKGLRNYDEIIDVTQKLNKEVSASIENNRFPLVLGGDHSIAVGSVSAISKHYNNLGVIWYDAHGDLNIPEESPSGNIHGMPLRILTGEGPKELLELNSNVIKPENIVLIGMRDLDKGERQFIKDHNIKTFTMSDIDKLGIKEVIENTIEYLKSRNVDGVHLSLDVDALDPLETPGTGTRVLGGLTYRESHFALELLHQSQSVTSMDLVEVNPLIDHNNHTAEQAVSLIGTFFGETLL